MCGEVGLVDEGMVSVRRSWNTRNLVHGKRVGNDWMILSRIVSNTSMIK